MFFARFFRRLKPVGSHRRLLKLMELKQSFSILIIILFVVFEIALFGFIAQRFMGDEALIDAPFEKNIAVINIDEEITSAYIERIIERLEVVRENPDKFAHLLVVMNSGGGSPTASDELRHYLDEMQMQGIPLTVYIESMCASGAYYIATASRFDANDSLSGIIANQNALVGSIGVIISYPIVEEAAKKLGVVQKSITVGKHKEPISMFKNPTQEDIDYLKNHWMIPVYENFLGEVARGRGVDVEALKPYADGKVYVANQIVGPLVDRISYLHRVKQELLVRYEEQFPQASLGLATISTKEEPRSLLQSVIDVTLHAPSLDNSVKMY
ncbi:MAG: hypothetical protein KU37_09655 [Sulfuricurvum sp. PC08-66]|nr:MAG: hypothetical protein KU37_09655 [Sulfuricurvum sp. PC08-66]